MSAFDDCIREVGASVASLVQRAPSAARELHCPGAPEPLLEGLPIRVGPGANPGVLLRSDTFMEFGNPAEGSCAGALWSEDTSLVVDGRIRIIGTDIGDIGDVEARSLPFAQILLVAGPELCVEDHEEIVAAQHVGDYIEGYMGRSTSDYVWARVSNEAAAKGFDFESLGRVLLYLMKTSVSKVSSAEVIFVTTSRDDVEHLSDIVDRSKEISREIVRDIWLARGFDLECDYDCTACSDKPVCDDVRDVIVETKKRSRGAKV